MNRHEHRYSERWCAADGVERLRCSIENVRTGQRRFELNETYVNGELYSPTVVQCLDRGSKGHVYIQWTRVGPPKMRTVVAYDPWHRVDGYLGETYHDCGTHFDKLAASVAYEAFRGP